MRPRLTGNAELANFIDYNLYFFTILLWTKTTDTNETSVIIKRQERKRMKLMIDLIKLYEP